MRSNGDICPRVSAMSTGQTRSGKQPASAGSRGSRSSDQWTPAGPQELDRQAGEQRLPDPRVARGDDIKLRLLRHASERPGWSDGKMKSRVALAPRTRNGRLRSAAGLGSRRRRLGRGVEQIEEFHAIVFGPDIAEPMSDIAAQHEGIISGFALAILVGNKGQEGNRGKFDL